MFQQFNQVLSAPLATNGTLVVTRDFDEFRIAAAGHLIMVDDTRYSSDKGDFSVSTDGSGDITLTWLAGATIASGKTLRIGIAYIDIIVGGGLFGSGGGGGGGGAVTSVDLGVKADTAATTDTGSFSLISLFKRFLQVMASTTRQGASNAVSGKTASMTATTATAVTGVAAPGASLFNYITQVVVSNAHATVGTNVRLQDGASGSAFGPSFPAAPAYGGVVVNFDPPLKQLTANTALYAINATTGAAVELAVNGFTGA